MSSNSTTRRSVVLRRRPRDEPSADDFEILEDEIPVPGVGEVVTRTIWLSIDPYMRGRLREEQTYAVAIQIGEVMTGETVGEVIASGHPGFVSWRHRIDAIDVDDVWRRAEEERRWRRRRAASWLGRVDGRPTTCRRAMVW